MDSLGKINEFSEMRQLIPFRNTCFSIIFPAYPNLSDSILYMVRKLSGATGVRSRRLVYLIDYVREYQG